jgi:hypothetical protein
MGLFSAETRVVSNGRTAIHIPLTNRWKKPHQSREHGAGVENLSNKRRKTMKKLMLITLALIALTISVPAAMARDANRDALDKVWKDQVKQENQQIRIERVKPGSEWDIVVPDPTQPGTPPGQQRPGRR